MDLSHNAVSFREWVATEFGQANVLFSIVATTNCVDGVDIYP